MLQQAIRYTATKGAKSPSGSIQILCHVKPGVNAKREGIAAVSDSAIEICVAAQAKEGEANKAVRELIAEVLKVPKSNVEVVKGLKSREKTIQIYNVTAAGTPEAELEKIKRSLQNALKD